MTLLWPTIYEVHATGADRHVSVRQGTALSVNLSTEGLLLIMDHAPVIDQILAITTPPSASASPTPTLAEVRWISPVLPKPKRQTTSYYVGLRFLR